MQLIEHLLRKGERQLAQLRGNAHFRFARVGVVGGGSGGAKSSGSSESSGGGHGGDDAR